MASNSGSPARRSLFGRPSTKRTALQHGKRAAAASVDVDIRARRFGWIDRWGLVTAQVFGWAALGPSLIPRRWWMTALTLSLSQISGYITGRSVHLAGRGVWFVAKRLVALRGRPAGKTALPRSRARSARILLASPRAEFERHGTGAGLRRRVLSGGAGIIGAIVGVGTVTSLRSSVTRQTEIAGLVRARMPATREQLGGIAAGMTIAGAALGLEWLRITATRDLRRLFGRVTPGAIAVSLGITIPVLALFFLSDRTIRRIWRQLVVSATSDNDLDIAGVTRPITALRSGSPASPIPWRSLGRHGRAFVGSGQRAAGISAATGRHAIEPIRAFASVNSWRSIGGAARAAASELRRTGAYDRGTLVITTTTGTGWLSDWSIGAAEHLTGGDCATVAVQYTVLPSGLAALGHPNAPVVAARALLAAVERDLAERPRERRPRIFVTGESLGAYGILGSVPSIDDLLSRVDGGVLAGAPRISKHWNELVARRDHESSEVAPVIDGGEHIRFATRPGELEVDSHGSAYAPWHRPRVAFLQHASDPIVWWSPQLLVQRPDWLRERVGRDVTRHMSWLPVVTFWQVATDMPAAVDTPGGYAHRYFEEYVSAWASVLGERIDDPTFARIIASIRRSLPLR